MKASRFAVTVYFGLAAGYAAVRAVELGHTAINHSTWHAWAFTAHLALQASAVALFAFFTIGRSEPTQRARQPRALAACTVSLLAFALLRQPPAAASTAGVLAGDAIAGIFGIWLVVAATRLGRCFGILPEARGLRTSGPYAIVRHPVYLGELGVCAGLVIAAPTMWNLALSGLFVAGQAVRMRLEEQALTQAFPAYAAYAATTPRLIPFFKLAPTTFRKASTTSSGA